MTTTTQDVAQLARISRETDAREVAQTAYDQLLALLGRLEREHWRRPTDCPDWSVADVVRHLVGAARGHASRVELVRQLLWGGRHKADFDGNAMDAMNHRQVSDHAELPPDELVEQLRELAPRAVAGRMRLPGVLRRAPVPVDMSGSVADGTPDELRLGHLQEAVLTRDVWLHSVDIERATGVAVDRGGLPDVRVVEDVVAEWAARHGQRFELVLTGPSGGRYRQGTDGPHLELEAVEFCRTLSGRAEAHHPLLRHRLWF